MLLQYIQTALECAHYEIIKDEEPFYGEVPPLAGVWATGKTLEECRRKRASPRRLARPIIPIPRGDAR